MKKEPETIKNIQNSFFDVVVFLMSFIFSFFRSFGYFFSSSLVTSKNYFFDFFDFAFRIWPRYFWRSPSLYKITAFFGHLIARIFSDKK